MRYFRPASILAVFLMTLNVPLAAEDESLTALQFIVEIDDAAKREAALRDRLSGIGSLNGRLLFLEEAAQQKTLTDIADRIRLALLLLSGRTEEAEGLLADFGETQSELGIRLAVSHGKVPLLQSGEGTSVPGLNSGSFQDLADNNSGSPEYYAARRGMIISAAFLLSPYFTAQPEAGQDHPAAEDSCSPKNENIAGGEIISIQVGAFSREQNALAHIGYLSEKGISAEILEQKRQDGAVVYKTVIPGIPQSSAQHELIRLKEKGIEGFILH